MTIPLGNDEMNSDKGRREEIYKKAQNSLQKNLILINNHLNQQSSTFNDFNDFKNFQYFTVSPTKPPI